MPTFRVTRIRASLANRDDAGMSTAEYAVGTVAAACIGCILVGLSQGDDAFFWDFLSEIFERIDSVLPYIGDFPGPNRPWLM